MDPGGDLKNEMDDDNVGTDMGQEASHSRQELEIDENSNKGSTEGTTTEASATPIISATTIETTNLPTTTATTSPSTMTMTPTTTITTPMPTTTAKSMVLSTQDERVSQVTFCQ